MGTMEYPEATGTFEHTLVPAVPTNQSFLNLREAVTQPAMTVACMSTHTEAMRQAVSARVLLLAVLCTIYLPVDV